MRKTLSPYYITVPLVSPLTSLICSEYRLEIYVWDGLKTSVPTLVTYSKTVVNSSSSNGEHNVNISRLINDFIEFEPQDNGSTALIDGNNQRWVKTQVFYNTTNQSELNTPQSVDLDIIVKGYTYGNEGANQSTPTNKNLINGTEFNVNRSGVFVLPIEIDEPPPPTPSLVITNVSLISGVDYQVTFTPVGSYSTLTAIATPTSGSPTNDVWITVTSPQNTIIEFTGDTIGVSIEGFDNATGTNVTSNTFNIVIP